ncbi:MAG TPA: nuclear transport factor 2 family protein [Candidatus Acidoferrales bacterium]|nr:nuclear transport factor 2 family protein [Candidatus Acidoferrales bacterium]
MKIGARVLVAAMAFSTSLLLGGTRVSEGTSTESRDHASNQAVLSMQEQIVAKEREGLDALKAGDVEHFGRLTAENAVFVDSAGPASKAQVVQNVGGFQLTDYTIDDVKFVPISQTSGLISYKITEKGNSHGRDFAAQAYVSSIWAKQQDDWVCLFSQETAIRQR